MKIPTLALCLFICISFALPLEAATFFVSASGNDDNDGTSRTSAWATTSKVNDTVFEAGDTILFEGGSTFTGGLAFDADDKGTPLLPIFLGSYGNGKAIISSGVETGLSVYNSAGFQIKNLVFRGAGSTVNSSSGIDFFTDLANNTRLKYIAIDGVEVMGYHLTGVLIGSWAGESGYDDVSITNSLVHDNGEAGIATYAEALLGHRNVYVGYNKVYNNSGLPERTDIHTGSGIMLGGVDGAVIEYCEVYNNGWLNAWKGGGPIGIWGYKCNNLTIQFNESHHNRTGTAKDGGGFDIDGGCTNSVMQYNYSHDNDGAGYLVAQYGGAPPMKGIVIRYNISENDGRKNGYGAIHLWSSGSEGGIQDLEVYNNTVYLSPAASGSPKALYVQSGGKTVANIRNNIFQTTGGIELVNAQVLANIRFEGNSYWATGNTAKFKWGSTTHSSLEAWRTATGQETLNGAPTGLYADPQLKAPGNGVNIKDMRLLYTLKGYELHENSPLAGKGLNLAALFGMITGKRDFFGNSIERRNDLTVGAHQLTENSKACLHGGITPLNFGPQDDGLYNGPGVIDGRYFDPQHIGTGNTALTYSFTDGNNQQQVTHHTVTVVDASSAEWTGAGVSNTDWFDSENWSTCVPTALIDASVPEKQSAPVLVVGSYAVARNLIGSAPIALEAGATLEVNGSLLLANLNADPNAVVVLKSDEPQQLAAWTFGKLVLQGAGAKYLTGAVTVTGSLELGQSNLYLGEHILTIGRLAGIRNQSSSSYIVTDGTGKLAYEAVGGSRAGVFPVGTVTGYAPVTLENAGTSDNFSVRVEDGYRQEVTSGDPVTAGVVNKTWHIEEETIGGSDVQMTLQWSETDELEQFSREESYISHYEGEIWGPQKQTYGSATAGTEEGTFTKSIAHVTSFSPFAVSSSGYTLMPVTLTYFRVNIIGNEALLQWETAMEQGNKGFGVEVSEDGTTFKMIGFVYSKQPDAQHRQQYSFRDTEQGKTGTRYYRLRQTDLDGTTTLSAVRAVTFQAPSLVTLSAYPNPFSGSFTLEITAAAREKVLLTVTDALGKTAYSRVIEVVPGGNKISLRLGDGHAPGLYILSARLEETSHQLKILKQ